jgi:Na+/H+ antiporter NhaD/arsenite permease-like protein
MLWTISLSTFFLSAILDNLTTTILMITFLRKLIPKFEERVVPGCFVVIAANAGGAWSPIGDITTTMLWIDGQISSLAVIKAVFLPSLVSLLVPLFFFTFKEKGRISGGISKDEGKEEPGARLIFALGVISFLFVPAFHALTELPPFMGMIAAVGGLWIVTDLLHFKYHERAHLRVPFILTKIDTASILFFLGVLLSMDALGSAGVLRKIAEGLSAYISSDATLAMVLGLISATVDNVPLVAATMGMYPLSDYPTDSSLWHMIAYAAGTGGSILLIGSAAGIVLMGMEKVNFFTYLKKASLPILIGFFAGLGSYLFLN